MSSNLVNLCKFFFKGDIMNTELLIKKMISISGTKSQKAFSKWMGVSQSYITKWKNQGYIPDEYIKKFNSEYGKLFTAPDEIKQVSCKTKEEYSLETKELSGWRKAVYEQMDSDIEPQNNMIQVKYYKDYVFCMGEGGTCEGLPSIMSFDKDFLMNSLGIRNFKDLFMIDALGDSMSPDIKNGAKLFITPFENENCTIVDGAVYAIFTPQSDYIVKRVALRVDGSIVLKSDNRDYEDMHLTLDLLEASKIIGRVVANLNRN